MPLQIEALGIAGRFREVDPLAAKTGHVPEIGVIVRRPIVIAITEVIVHAQRAFRGRSEALLRSACAANCT